MKLLIFIYIVTYCIELDEKNVFLIHKNKM